MNPDGLKTKSVVPVNKEKKLFTLLIPQSSNHLKLSACGRISSGLACLHAGSAVLATTTETRATQPCLHVKDVNR